MRPDPGKFQKTFFRLKPADAQSDWPGRQPERSAGRCLPFRADRPVKVDVDTIWDEMPARFRNPCGGQLVVDLLTNDVERIDAGQHERKPPPV